MEFTTENQPDTSLKEGEIYRAILMEVSPKEVRWTPTKGPDAGVEQCKILLEWWWEIQDERAVNLETGMRRRVKGSCDAKLSNNPGNRFRNWAEAILQREFDVGTKIDTDDLLALPADITIAKKPDRKDPNKFWDEISDVLPAVGGFEEEPPF